MLEGQPVFRAVTAGSLREFLNALGLGDGQWNGGLLKLSPSPQYWDVAHRGLGGKALPPSLGGRK